MVCAAVLGCCGWWAARAPAVVSCDPSIQDCSGNQYAQAQALFTQLNNDIAAYPPNPCVSTGGSCVSAKQTTTLLATQAESLYPPQPLRPSDFCPSYSKFGALANYTQGLLNAFPPSPIYPPNPFFTAVLNDTLAIRSASIWSFFCWTVQYPPNPCISG
jgi:hypothetical protein